MTSLRGRIAINLGVILALIPLLLFAFMALHFRLMEDDYVYLGLARDIGIWEAMALWRGFWNGGYTNFLVYGLLAPFGERAPSLFALFFCATAFAGFGWLLDTLLAWLGIRAHRRAIVVALAALSTAAIINGLYTASVFYLMTNLVVYHWPAAMLLVGIALASAIGRRLRGRTQHALAAAATAFYAFVNGGFSEMYLGFQLSALALISGFAFVFHTGPKRRTWRILAAAATLGTVLSLLLQVSSPGFAFRSARTDYFGQPLIPARDLPQLLERTLHETLYYAGQPNSFAGFMLIVFAGIFLIAAAEKRSRDNSQPPKRSISKAPIAIALLPQLLFIPILWSHQSDSLQVLSRFSYAFALVVGINLLAILVSLTLLSQGGRFERLANRRNGLMIYCAGVLLFVCLVFALTQARDIDFKASAYLFVTAVSTLLMLAGQLAAYANESRLRALFRIGAFAWVGALLILAALLAVSLWGVGLIFERTLTASVYALMFAALMIGVTLGVAIRQAACMTDANASWLRWIRLGSLLAALTIAAGIVIGQGQRLGYARRNAELWDATRAEIIRLRDAGDQTVFTRRFPRPSYDEIGAAPSNGKLYQLEWRQMIWYGLLPEGAAYEDCVCSSEMMALGDEAPFCARVNCLAYGASDEE